MSAVRLIGSLSLYILSFGAAPECGRRSQVVPNLCQTRAKLELKRTKIVPIMDTTAKQQFIKLGSAWALVPGQARFVAGPSLGLLGYRRGTYKYLNNL